MRKMRARSILLLIKTCFRWEKISGTDGAASYKRVGWSREIKVIYQKQM